VVYKPEQLVILSNPDESGMWSGTWDGPRNFLTYAEFEQLRDHADSFSAMMESQSSLNNWQIRFEGGEWEEARGRLVSGGFFQALGVGASIGRVFAAGDDRADTPDAVISYDYWQRTLRRQPRRAGQGIHPAQIGPDHHRCRTARLHR